MVQSALIIGETRFQQDRFAAAQATDLGGQELIQFRKRPNLRKISGNFLDAQLQMKKRVMIATHSCDICCENRMVQPTEPKGLGHLPAEAAGSLVC